MATIVSLLRAVNLGAHNRMKMDALLEVYSSLGFANVRTYVQSGNVVFETREKNGPALVGRIEDAIEVAFGFRADVINRTAAELRDVVARNPFVGREPDKVLVTFLASDPGEAVRGRLRDIQISPEELVADGRELYIYYPNGQGRSKLPVASIDKALGVRGTGRNWNTVTKLLEMAG
jgi:uncharacterized protein (DUF1697 family)